MMSCEEFTSRMTEFLDSKLPFGKKMGMWMHKLMCVRCRNCLRQIEELVDFIGERGSAAQRPLDEETKDELLSNFVHHHCTECPEEA